MAPAFLPRMAIGLALCAAGFMVFVAVANAAIKVWQYYVRYVKFPIESFDD